MQDAATATNPGEVVGRVIPSLTLTRRLGNDASGQYRLAIEELLSALKSTPHGAQGSAAQIIARTEQLLERTGALDSAVNEGTLPARPAPLRERVLASLQVKLTKSYVASHLDSKITTQQLAALARLSPFYFARAFKASVGDSPHRYLLRQRMERSQGLMLRTSASLADIALDCGLVDQAHFGRLFRQLVGESPAAWRRSRASENPLLRQNRRNVPPNAGLSQTQFTAAI